MGLYFTSIIECVECSNSVTVDTGFDIKLPDDITFVFEKRPRIICGRCGSEKIRCSDTYFCSADTLTIRNAVRVSLNTGIRTVFHSVYFWITMAIKVLKIFITN